MSGHLTVLNDVNGKQVTYNGHPLYTFADDHANQATGQGIQNFFVATPSLCPDQPAARRRRAAPMPPEPDPAAVTATDTPQRLR